jgi:arginine/ornithine transport system substrate-binding protein
MRASALLLLLAVALLALAVAPAAALERRELRVGVETASPPFSALDAFGGFRGFNVDVTRALCEQMHVNCTLVGTNIGDAIQQLQNRVVDLVVASMTITAERRQLVDFTDPYFRSGNRAVGPRGMPEDLSPQALRGKTIGVHRGTTHDAYATATYGSIATIRRYADRDELFIDLALGRLDLVISDGVATRSAFLDTELGAGFAFIGPELEAPQFFGEGEAIAVRKGDEELRQALNDALKRIRANGTAAAISREYFGADLPTN